MRNVLKRMENQFSDFCDFCSILYSTVQLTVNWGLRDFWEPYSDANQWCWGFNPKPCGVQGRSLGEGCGVQSPLSIFSSQMDKMFFDKLLSKVVIFTWKMRNVLKQMKNQFSDFLQFLVFEIWSFLYSKLVNFRWILSTKSTITQKIKIGKIRKIDFSSDSALCASFLKIWPFLRRGGGRRREGRGWSAYH